MPFPWTSKGKLFPVHNMQAQWGSRSRPLILNLSIRRRWVVNCKCQLLYPLGGPQSSLDVLEELKIYCPCRDMNPTVQPIAQLLYPLCYFSSYTRTSSWNNTLHFIYLYWNCEDRNMLYVIWGLKQITVIKLIISNRCLLLWLHQLPYIQCNDLVNFC
jgi:hypothetical protein